jgi:hypothetical protein
MAGDDAGVDGGGFLDDAGVDGGECAHGKVFAKGACVEVASPWVREELVNRTNGEPREDAGPRCIVSHEWEVEAVRDVAVDWAGAVHVAYALGDTAVGCCTDGVVASCAEHETAWAFRHVETASVGQRRITDFEKWSGPCLGRAFDGSEWAACVTQSSAGTLGIELRSDGPVLFANAVLAPFVSRLYGVSVALAGTAAIVSTRDALYFCDDVTTAAPGCFVVDAINGTGRPAIWRDGATVKLAYSEHLAGGNVLCVRTRSGAGTFARRDLLGVFASAGDVIRFNARGEVAVVAQSGTTLTYAAEATGFRRETVGTDADLVGAFDVAFGADGVPRIAYPATNSLRLATKLGARWKNEFVHPSSSIYGADVDAVTLALKANGQAVIVSRSTRKDGATLWLSR